jgi:crossover junction endodeoxyribonuclease RuvC
MSTIILGIDPGIGRTGYAFLEKKGNENQVLLAYGCITTPTKTEIYIRLNKLYDDLTKLIKKYKPDTMAVEKLFFNTNAKTATMVGQAMGTIFLAGAKANLKIYELTPLQVKVALTGYGRADKTQVQKMVVTLLDLKIKPTPDDAADAIAVALCQAVRNPRLS